MMYHSFEDLEVWQRGCRLAVLVYEALKETREFGLRDQMQRAAVSIPSNIAEGAERGGKDFERFLRIARGSAAELRTQLYIARKIGILTDERFSHLIPELRRVSRMLTGLAHSLASSPSDRTENRRPKTENRSEATSPANPPGDRTENRKPKTENRSEATP